MSDAEKSQALAVALSEACLLISEIRGYVPSETMRDNIASKVSEWLAMVADSARPLDES